MKEIKKNIENAYKIIVYVIGIYLLGIITFFNLTKKVNNIAIVIFEIIIIIVALILFNKFIINKLNKKSCKYLILILIVIFLALEILSMFFFRVSFNGDARKVVQTATELYQKHTMNEENRKYFLLYPHNIGTLLILTIGMIIFRGEYGAYIINIIFVLAAFVFSILCAKKIKDEKLALNVAIILVFFCPLYMYLPILYSDTLSCMFPELILYLWLIVKKKNKANNRKEVVIYTIIMAICSFIGFSIKPIIAIMIIAIFINEIFTFGKEIKFIVLSLILFFTFNGIYNSFCYKYILKDVPKNNIVLPYTHWIAMGLAMPKSEGGTSIGWGAFDQKNFITTNSKKTYSEKVESNLESIRESINGYGAYGYIIFLKHKLIYLWTNSNFDLIESVTYDILNTRTKIYNFTFNKQNNQPFLNYLDAFYDAMLIVMFIGWIIDLKREKNYAIRIIELSFIGVIIFLLIWEARARYIYFIMPTLSILFANGIELLVNSKIFSKNEEKHLIV